jgi:hypothetical protein
MALANSNDSRKLRQIADAYRRVEIEAYKGEKGEVGNKGNRNYR